MEQMLVTCSGSDGLDRIGVRWQETFLADSDTSLMTQVIKERNIYHIRYYFRKTKHYSLLLFLPSNFHELYCLKQHSFSQFP